MDRIEKAFDFAADATKQLITLSTAIILVTITFLTDIVGNVPGQAQAVLTWSWITFILSIGFGVWTLLALTGTLEPKPGSQAAASIRGSNVTIPAFLQLVSFLAGIILTVTVGTIALGA